MSVCTHIRQKHLNGCRFHLSRGACNKQAQRTEIEGDRARAAAEGHNDLGLWHRGAQIVTGQGVFAKRACASSPFSGVTHREALPASVR